MRIIITADLHLTNRPLDGYRWDFLDWVKCQEFDTLMILGDLTDDTDKHSAALVNRVVSVISSIADMGKDVHILMGNHDYATPDSPFFKFLSHITRVTYYSTPQIREVGNTRWAFYPHSREPDKYFRELIANRKIDVDYTACHQTFSGAIGENRRQLSGVEPSVVKGLGKIFAGDVHTPQTIGGVEYVGSPYPVRFGDDFVPRVVLLDGVNRTHKYLHPPYIQKLKLEISDPGDIENDDSWQAGDQVKIILDLERSKFSKWEDYRKHIRIICERNELHLCGIELRERKSATLSDSPAKSKVVGSSRESQFDAYCKALKVSKDDTKFGKSLLES